MKLADKMTDEEVLHGLLEKCAEYGLTNSPLFKASFDEHFTFKFPNQILLKQQLKYTRVFHKWKDYSNHPLKCENGHPVILRTDYPTTYKLG